MNDIDPEAQRTLDICSAMDKIVLSNLSSYMMSYRLFYFSKSNLNTETTGHERMQVLDQLRSRIVPDGIEEVVLKKSKKSLRKCLQNLDEKDRNELFNLLLEFLTMKKQYFISSAELYYIPSL